MPAMFLWHVTFDLLTPKINVFPLLIVKHFHVKFGDPSCIGFRDIVRENRHTYKIMDVKTPCTSTTAVRMGEIDGHICEFNAQFRRNNIVHAATASNR